MYESFQSSCSLKNKASNFSYSHTFKQNKSETHELYKPEKGKRKVKNSGAVFVDVPVLAAWGLYLLRRQNWNFSSPIVGNVRFRLKLDLLSSFKKLSDGVCVSTGITGHRTIQKLVSTVLFLYFACLLPSIAFGVLNSRNTAGKLGTVQVWNEPGYRYWKPCVVLFLSYWNGSEHSRFISLQ